MVCENGGLVYPIRFYGIVSCDKLPKNVTKNVVMRHKIQVKLNENLKLLWYAKTCSDSEKLKAITLYGHCLISLTLT